MRLTEHPPPPVPPGRRAGPHLWQIAAVRDAVVAAVFIFAVWFAWSVIDILLPVLVAFILAFVFDPIVAYARRKGSVPRIVTTVFLLALFIGAAVAVVAWVGPIFYKQTSQLLNRLPHYYQRVTGEPLGNVDGVSKEIADLTKHFSHQPMSSLQKIAGGTSRLFGFIGTVVSAAIYAVFVIVLIPLIFLVFSWHFHHIEELRRYIPASRRREALRTINKIVDAFANFFRGRLVVALIIAAMSAFGWWLIGVPFWFLVGIVTGVASLIPYGSIVGWLIAMALVYFESSGGVNWTNVFFWPTFVYLFVHLTEGWLITPFIQGHATDLHPATVLVVLYIGGSVGGLWGMLFAIPVTASLKIVLLDVLLPKWDFWASEH